MKLPTDLAQHSSKEFIETFENVYEHSPWIVKQSLEQVLANNEYNNLEIFHQLLCEIMLQAGSDLQNNLILSHPMLAGKKAQNNELTEFSTTEQKSAGLNSCSPEQYQQFNELNNLYRKKFDFPFIIAVTGLNVEKILTIFIKRLDNDYNSEFNEAIKQVHKIDEIRINQIIKNRGK